MIQYYYYIIFGYILQNLIGYFSSLKNSSLKKETADAEFLVEAAGVLP
jgi:hypothetical protein